MSFENPSPWSFVIFLGFLALITIIVIVPLKIQEYKERKKQRLRKLSHCNWSYDRDNKEITITTCVDGNLQSSVVKLEDLVDKEEKCMVINILGTEYEILVQKEADNPKLEEANGLCEMYAKKIVIRDIELDKFCFDNLDAFKKKVLRHEILHAFFAESGLRNNCEYAQDEELVDWIAIQFYKIAKAFKDAGCDEEEQLNGKL